MTCRDTITIYGLIWRKMRQMPKDIASQKKSEFSRRGAPCVISTMSLISGNFRENSTGRSGVIRTLDPHVPNVVRYQTALHSVTSGAVYRPGFFSAQAPPSKKIDLQPVFFAARFSPQCARACAAGESARNAKKRCMEARNAFDSAAIPARAEDANRDICCKFQHQRHRPYSPAISTDGPR